MSTNNTPKICLIHDMFLYRGWAERFNIMLAKSLGADIAALFFNPEGLDPRSMGFTGNLISFGQNRYHKGLRQIYLKYRVLFHTKFLAEYDTVIFSNDSLSAIRNVWPRTRKIYYAHSIPRYLFDQRAFYYQKVPILLRPLYRIIRALFEHMYRWELAQVDEIYTNSANLQRAIRQYLWRESHIIHPPVDTEVFIPLSQYQEAPGVSEDARFLHGERSLLPGMKWQDKEYYISFSKLSSLKRVARAVEVFYDMPDKKLLVIYGQNDPQKDEIIALAKGCDNIVFLTLVDNSMLPRYVAGAIATIFIAKNEDFGMVAIESLSCGVPVIGVDEWGIKETVTDGETGILISPEVIKEHLVQAIDELTSEKAVSMEISCVRRAQQFSLKTFEKMVKEKFL